MDASAGLVLGVYSSVPSSFTDTYSFLVGPTASGIRLLDAAPSVPSAEPAPSAPAPAPAPKPGFEDEEGWDDGEDLSNPDSLMSDLNFILLGAILGILATLAYWQVVKLCQTRREIHVDDEELGMPDPN